MCFCNKIVFMLRDTRAAYTDLNLFDSTLNERRSQDFSQTETLSPIFCRDQDGSSCLHCCVHFMHVWMKVCQSRSNCTVYSSCQLTALKLVQISIKRNTQSILDEKHLDWGLALLWAATRFLKETEVQILISTQHHRSCAPELCTKTDEWDSAVWATAPSGALRWCILTCTSVSCAWANFGLNEGALRPSAAFLQRHVRQKSTSETETSFPFMHVLLDDCSKLTHL